ncbi:MAG: hypothetical protein KA368_23760 [Acidobacteria bacterium]|nr:hypothetical protein [Acidobacteriota bacterium]
MKFQRTTFNSMLGLLILVITMLANSSIAQAAEPTDAWTTIGSVGSATEVSRKCFRQSGTMLVIILNCAATPPSPVTLQDAAIGLADVPAYQGPVAAPPPDYDYEDTVTIRYNVTAVDGLFTQNSNAIRMTVRYLDPGDYASLTVKLIEKNLTTGAKTTRLSFASNQYPSSPSYQVQYASDGNQTDFDFSQNVYYIEATMKMTREVIVNPFLAGPKLEMIKLDKVFLFNPTFPFEIPLPGN